VTYLKTTGSKELPAVVVVRKAKQSVLSTTIVSSVEAPIENRRWM